MGQENLLVVCISALIAVFILLSLLALVMKLIIIIFPMKAGRSDAVLLAAVATAVSTIYPGTKLTNIEEIK